MAEKQINQKKNLFSSREEEVLNFWDKAKIFEKSIVKEAPRGNYIFYEGPPTANGAPGIHHILARAFKDIILKYRTMKGYRVERKAGWDTHGLPVEIQVEKELGISGKSEIEKFGVEEFNKKCKNSVWQFKDEWEKLTRRIAFWLDMENPYVTYENNYIETVWWIVKQAHEKNLLYKGYKVVPHCPRCGTALSSHEVSQGYKKVKENSVYLNFQVVKGNKKIKAGDIILAWTTTPWTLPGNVALAVGENIDYVKIDSNGKNYILAKERLDIIKDNYKIKDEFKGNDLLGVEYEPLFRVKSIKESPKRAYYVAPADFVTTEDGTGVVHTAVMYGEDDYKLGEKINLPKIHTVDETGRFSSELAEYNLAGKFVKDEETENIILFSLRERGLLFAEEMYEHDYPFCWRCGTPLLYYAKDSWFIKMTAVKDDLIANNQSINWVPKHIKTGRFGEWLDNVKDWAISRERYWGTPLPVWECAKCGRIKVIGSAKELGADLADLHRPFVDKIKIKCQCGGEMARDQSVLDCWFDSGSMPFAQQHYPFENKNLIEEKIQYPADYICEAIDQTRGWFYTLLAISTFLGEGASYKNVICLGHINDKYGKKMSKSKGNIINPEDVINDYGVDAIRMHMYTINRPGDGKNYDLNDVRDALRKNVMVLWNVCKFYEIYLDKKTKIKRQAVPAGRREAKIDSTNVLDKWIIARLKQVIKKTDKELNRYYVYEAAKEIPEFINDLSTWYLRRSRQRFKDEDKKEKNQVLATMGFVLLEASKAIAPFMPFISELIWQKVAGYDFKDKNQSVHLEPWPEKNLEILEEELKILDQMAIVRKIVEMGLAKRDEAGVKVRQPLSKFSIFNFPSNSAGKQFSIKDYENLIKDELNVKEVVFIKGEGEMKVELDTEITEELKLEGIKRELVRFINNLRKQAGLTVKDKIAVVYFTNSKNIKTAINKFLPDIVRDTISISLKEELAVEDSAISKTVKINSEEIRLSVKV